MPIFVRAGSIVPLGAPIQNTATKQPLTEIRVFPGHNASFTLYDDDGVTNAYKKGGGKSATLRWDDAAKKLTASGALPTGQGAASLVKVIGTQ
jgi:alpha-D-xyloside xylohydrolase